MTFTVYVRLGYSGTEICLPPGQSQSMSVKYIQGMLASYHTVSFAVPVSVLNSGHQASALLMEEKMKMS